MLIPFAVNYEISLQRQLAHSSIPDNGHIIWSGACVSFVQTSGPMHHEIYLLDIRKASLLRGCSRPLIGIWIGQPIIECVGSVNEPIIGGVVTIVHDQVLNGLVGSGFRGVDGTICGEQCTSHVKDFR